MWSALSKLFSKTATSPQTVESNAEDNTMERIEDRRKSTIQDRESRDSYDTRQAKLRACLKWLLSKAFNNRVPDDFLDPLYKDNEDQYHIKPQLVHAMANAELYCLALSNIYCDPNYHSLNHIGVVQAIGRKGVVVGPPSDGCPLTETILIQTNPLRVGAHMAVLEALMVLYAKEVVTPDRVLAATIRFHPPSASMPPPQGHEEALLVWINGSCAALERREAARYQQEGEGNSKSIPRLPEAKKIEDLKDGACLAALVCFYCPEEVSWSEIHLPPPPPLPPLVSDAIHNLCLVRDFCHRCCAPPSSPTSYSFPFHLAPEDIAYLQSSATRQNLVTFLADLFNLLEIHPVKCVRFPGVSDSIPPAHLREAPQCRRPETKKKSKSSRKKKNRNQSGVSEAYPRNSQGVAHKRSFQQSISPIPDLRSGLASPMAAAQTPPATGKDGTTAAHAQVAGTVPKYVDAESTLSLSSGSTCSSPYSEIYQTESGSSKSTTPGSSSGGATSTPSPSAPIPRRISHAGRHPSATSQSLENTPLRSSAREVEETHGRDRVGNAASDDGGDDQDFVVHRGKGVPTLGRIASDGTENTNGGTPAMPAAGKPSNWEDLRRTPSSSSFYAGRRSRRNSISDESQLTIENFGGSKENLNMWSDTMSSIPHSGRATTPTKSREEANVWSENVVRSKPITHRPEWEGPSEGMPAEPVAQPVTHNTTAADDSLGSGTSESGEKSGGYSGPNSRTGSTREKKTTFAALPNTTTWLQQVQRVDSESDNIEGGGKNQIKNEPAPVGVETGVQLHDIRLKMEEKRRHIEGEKRRMEAAVGQQRQRVGKAAFLQAVVKGKGTSPHDDAEPEDMVSLRDMDRPDQQHRRSRPISPAQGSIGNENSNLSSWARTKGTPMVLDNADSVTHINAAIQEVRSDIRRLAIQQQKMDANVNEEVGKGEHFFLHGPAMGGRRTWDSGEPTPPPPFSLQQQQHHHHPPPPPVEAYYQEKPQHYPVMTRWGAPTNNNNKGVGMGQQQPQVVYGGSPRPVTMYDMPSHQQPSSHWEGNSPSYRPGDRNVPMNEMEPRVERRLFSGQQLQQHQHLHQNGGGDHGHPQQHTNGPSGPLYLHPHDGRSTSPFSLYQRDEVVNDQKRLNSGGGESNTAVHAPVPTPSVDDMEPQSISFIGNLPNEVSGPPRDLHLRISSGTRTYRITSPGHPSSQSERRHAASSLPPVDGGMEGGGTPWMHGSKDPSSLHTESLRDGVTPEKGFYISLDGDGDAPRRPKPHLRRRAQPNVINSSPASNMTSRPTPSGRYGDEFGAGSEGESRSDDDESGGKGPGETSSSEEVPHSGGGSRSEAVGLVVGVTPEALDPGTLDEMERRKERILLMSLQRRERQEEEKRRKEVDAMQRRDDIKAREEERQRKREEERRRRAEILEKYRLKRAIEEAEREGKHDPTKGMPPSLGSSSSGGPRMRGGPGGRPRPKTIHVDGTDAPEMRSGTLTPSRGRKGSGSSLADSPDDGQASSPCRGSAQLGRRSSCRTSRDAGSAGRPNKGSTYQRMTFRGRKSNSLVNLSGSGSDQESVAFRHGDTDSGLGRATPPRRAPSPGMGPHGRHLPSPSGPGSLPPGLVIRRRPFGDDGASDISSTPSSMLEYTGPRLYKQPTTKSNRSIILNAVEYCVFPGAVNKEAKARVLEEIARSMSKHFLILFRDAGCQFRALYSYSPEGIGEEGIVGSSPQVMQDQVSKLYGTGPRNVTERMFDKFFKYNSGGKCFSQVHTKHLTVTIDAFTIHNSLWQGKKAGNLPNKKDLTLII